MSVGYFSTQYLVECGVNILIYATILTSIALGLGGLLSRRAVMRHWLFLTTIILIIVSPVTVPLMRSAGTSLPTVSVASFRAATTDAMVETIRGTQGSTAHREPPIKREQRAIVVTPDESETLGPTVVSASAPAIQPRVDDPNTSQIFGEDNSGAAFSNLFLIALNLIVFVWTVVAAALFVRLLLTWRRMTVLIKSAASITSEPIVSAFYRSCIEMGFRDHATRPLLVVSDQISGPIAAGVLRPRVILPARLLGSIQPEKLDDIFLHELAHIARRDQVVVLVQNFVGALFWIHPLVNMINRELAQAREEICDNYVLAKGDAPAYGRTLLDIAQSVPSSSAITGAVGLFASKWKLEYRIAGLLDERRHQATRLTSGSFVLVTALSCVVGCTAFLGTLAFAVDTPGPILADTPLTAQETTNSRTPKPADSSTFVAGLVSLHDGKPAVGATVSVVGDADVLGESVANAQGRYRIRLGELQSTISANLKVVARTDESGIGWADISPKGLDSEDEVIAVANLTLPATHPLKGRMVTLEGQPIAGLNISVVAVARADEQDDIGWRESISFYASKRNPKAWVQSTETDGDGYFTIRHVPMGFGARLITKGTDQFAPQGFQLNTGVSERRREGDGTYRDTVRNAETPDEIVILPVAPAQTFEGVVLLGDSEKRAANSKIAIWAAQQGSGSMMNVFGTTDDQGRFELTPYPGVRFGIIAYPPHGLPYHIKELGPLRWTPGGASRNLEVRLTEGVLLEGTVVNQKTGRPIADASVQYVPTSKTESQLPEEVVTGWQSIKKTDASGRFSITVAPGPASLLVHAPDRRYVLKMQSSRKLYQLGGDAGGLWYYAHAFQPIDPRKGESVSDLRIELTPGEAVSGKIVGPDDQVAKGALIVSRLQIAPDSPVWRAMPDRAADGQFTIEGLTPGAEYPVLFLDPVNRWGATAMISTRTPSPTVKLLPCGNATASFVDKDGNPTDSTSLHIVVSPGKPKYGGAAGAGNSFADEDFVSNIDPVNHGRHAIADTGAVTYSALIPGARYRVDYKAPNGNLIHREFTGEAGKTIDLGKLVTSVDD